MRPDVPFRCTSFGGKLLWDTFMDSLSKHRIAFWIEYLNHPSFRWGSMPSIGQSSQKSNFGSKGQILGIAHTQVLDYQWRIRRDSNHQLLCIVMHKCVSSCILVHHRFWTRCTKMRHDVKSLSQTAAKTVATRWSQCQHFLPPSNYVRRFLPP
jgi:hypothetical protein